MPSTSLAEKESSVPKVSKHRSTPRKKLIETVLRERFRGRAVILEELRWSVYPDEMASKGHPIGEMSESYRKCFNRTVRAYSIDFGVQNLRIDGSTPLGMLARAAVYRLKTTDQLAAFRGSPDPCIVCRWQASMIANRPRYRSYATPHFHAAQFWLFERRPEETSYEVLDAAPWKVLIPTTCRLAIVTRRRAELDLLDVCECPWMLLGYYGPKEWGEVDATDPLGCIKS